MHVDALPVFRVLNKSKQLTPSAMKAKRFRMLLPFQIGLSLFSSDNTEETANSSAERIT